MGYEGEYPYAFEVGEGGVAVRTYFGLTGGVEDRLFLQVEIDHWDEGRIERWFEVGCDGLKEFDRFSEETRGDVTIEEFQSRFRGRQAIEGPGSDSNRSDDAA